MTGADSSGFRLAAAKDVIPGFARLAVGWHYGTGHPISQAVVGRALESDRRLRGFGMHTTAFPGEDGGILLCGRVNTDSAELRLEVSGRSSLVYEREGEEIFDEESMSDDDAIGKISVLMAVQCATSASPIRDTTMSRSAASALKLFDAPLRNGVVGHRSSPATASLRMAEASVSISSVSIVRRSLATPRYSSSLTFQSFHQATG